MTPRISAPTWRINLLLIALGLVGGALVAIPLTWFGKWIADAPAPATMAEYLWNVRAFAVLGGVFSPMLTWSAMRRVPLWRAALEPAAAGSIGATAGMALGSGVAFLGLGAAGIVLAAWRLNHSHRDRNMLSPGGARELDSTDRSPRDER